MRSLVRYVLWPTYPFSPGSSFLFILIFSSFALFQSLFVNLIYKIEIQYGNIISDNLTSPICAKMSAVISIAKIKPRYFWFQAWFIYSFIVWLSCFQQQLCQLFDTGW